ncbi:MAG: spore germination protein [Mediterraneibacter gnavus]
MVIKNTKQISDSFRENIEYMDRTLPIGKSFDLIRREIEIGERRAILYFIDGFVKDEAMLKLLDSFMGVTKKICRRMRRHFRKPMCRTSRWTFCLILTRYFRNVLSGVSCLFIEGYASCIAIDTRTYPARSVEEPDKDKSLRGSRDGFVETIVFNTALMRRRIRDEHLIMEMTEAGADLPYGYCHLLSVGSGGSGALANVKSRIEDLRY